MVCCLLSYFARAHWTVYNYYKEAGNMIIQQDNEKDTWKSNYVADQLGN